MRKKNRLVFGVGVNDVTYTVVKFKMVDCPVKGHKRITDWICPYYVKWYEMLRRCYSEKFQTRRPTYIGCSVDPDWLYLSNFIKWVDSQPNRDWRNCQPDKDFLVEGNKHYSPDTCIFVSGNLNNFILACGVVRGEYSVGVSWHEVSGRFQSKCCDPFKIESRTLGYFKTELEAHKAWQAKKHEYACQLADLQSDPRVIEVLRTKYAPDKDWTNK